MLFPHTKSNLIDNFLDIRDISMLYLVFWYCISILHQMPGTVPGLLCGRASTTQESQGVS